MQASKNTEIAPFNDSTLFREPLKESLSTQFQWEKNFDPTYVPVSSLIIADQNIDDQLVTQEILLFCYRSVIRTLDALIKKEYSAFDAHTTTNCCHGMSLLSRDLILACLQLDLEEIRQSGVEKTQSLEHSDDNCKNRSFWTIPKPLKDLACLYLLTHVKEIDPQKGGRTVTTKLKTIAPISTNLCNKIAHELKKKFANLVAIRYDFLLEQMDGDYKINGAPISLWGKYIQSEYIRTDKYGLKYSSSLFSMQVCLAHLVLSRAIVAIVNDLIGLDGRLRGRYVQFFEGDGENRLKPLVGEDLKLLKLFHKEQPVVVIGGCVYSDTHNMVSLTKSLDPWISQFCRLVLACEVFYPQFPRVSKDPNFDDTPIFPSEKILQEILNTLSSIQGVSADDPSLFCATHIYSASVEQVLKVQKKENEMELPLSFLPERISEAVQEKESFVSAR